MKNGASALSLAFILTLVLGVGSTWAFECPKLYAQCQELLKTVENEVAARMCEEGMRLHKAGDHDASVDKLEAALDILKEEQMKQEKLY